MDSADALAVEARHALDALGAITLALSIRSVEADHLALSPEDTLALLREIGDVVAAVNRMLALAEH